MTRIQRWLLGAAAIGLSVAVFFWTFLRWTGGLETSDVVKEAAVKKAEVTVPEDGVQCVVAVRLREWFEADRNATALHFTVKNEKDAAGRLVTLIGTAKAETMLRIEWAEGVVRNAGPWNCMDGLSLSDLAPEQRQPNSRRVVASLRQKRDRSRVLWITERTGTGEKRRTEFEYDFSGFGNVACYAPPALPLAFLPKIQKSNGALASLMVLDVDDLTLLGEIIPPLEARTSRPFFALDRKNGVILAADFAVDWLMLIDCTGYLDQKAKVE